jgi:hypothetical protein
MFMETYTDICGLWGDDEAMADDVGATTGAVQKWRLRDKIPAGWWQAVVDAAARRCLVGVTLDALAEIAAKKREAA